MHRTWRTVIFFSFLLMFLISAPLVVLYTAGYRVDVTAGRITHTGVLNVTSTPRGVVVSIDGKSQSDRTPAVFDDVFPGEHVITLTKNGYTTWEKTLEIESRETTFIADALLFLETAFESIDDREPTLTSLSPTKDALAYLISEGSWVELWITDTRSDSERLLARIPEEEGATYTITWSAEGTRIALMQDGFTRETISLVDVATGETQTLPSAIERADRFWWDVATDDYFYAEQSDVVYRIAISTQDLELVSYSADSIMHTDQDIVLSATSDRVALSRFEDDTATIITYLPVGTYQFHPAPNNLALIEDVGRERIILVDLSSQDQPILLNEDAVSWDWSEDGDRLVFTDQFDLEVYTRSSHTTQTLTRQSEHVNQVVWYPKGDAILYATDTSISSLERDTRDGHEMIQLAEGDLGLFWIDEQGERLSVTGLINDISGIHTRRLQR